MNGDGCLGGGLDVAQLEFLEQGTLVDLFQESGPKMLETSRIAPITRCLTGTL